MHWPFQVVGEYGGKPIIQVSFKGEVKQFAPEEISSMILIKMRSLLKLILAVK
jgi:L1 cell adhesion molecule like protein